MPPWENNPLVYPAKQGSSGAQAIDRARRNMNLTQIDRTPVIRKCMGRCGKDFETFQDGPRQCPNCRKRRE